MIRIPITELLFFLRLIVFPGLCAIVSALLITWIFVVVVPKMVMLISNAFKEVKPNENVLNRIKNANLEQENTKTGKADKLGNFNQTMMKRLNADKKANFNLRFVHLRKESPHAAFGFSICTIEFDEHMGNFIRKVTPNSPAFAAGIKSGDRVLQINGNYISHLDHKMLPPFVQQNPTEVELLVLSFSTDEPKTERYSKSTKSDKKTPHAMDSIQAKHANRSGLLDINVAQLRNCLDVLDINVAKLGGKLESNSERLDTEVRELSSKIRILEDRYTEMHTTELLAKVKEIISSTIVSLNQGNECSISEDITKEEALTENHSKMEVEDKNVEELDDSKSETSDGWVELV